MRRLSTVPALTVLMTLALAAPAFAAEHDNGEGLVGETNDKIITFFSLGVVIFFFLVVCIGSYIQNRLDIRKQQRKAESLKQRVGW